MRVNGPYTRADGRAHVIITHDDGHRQTMSWPKYVMQQKLGREIDSSIEEVDHINNNRSDNREENFQILSKKENRYKSDLLRPARLYHFNCPVCGKRAQIQYRYYKHNQLNQGKAGPFCSKQCAGKYTNGGWVTH